MENFDVGKKIFDVLLRLADKTLLNCDGKIYKESRNLNLGEFVLSEIAVREIGLGNENPDASSLLDALVTDSKSWPVSLAAWNRGKNGKNVYFRLNRSAVLYDILNFETRGERTFADGLKKILLICDLPKHSSDSSLSLSQLRCLYFCLMQKRVWGSEAELVILPPEQRGAINPNWAKLESTSDVSDAQLSNLEKWKQKFPPKLVTKDERGDLILDVKESAAKTSDSLVRDDSLDRVKVSDEMLRYLSIIEELLSSGEYRKICFFVPVSRERKTKELRIVWNVVTSHSNFEFEIKTVGNVVPDLPVRDTWESKYDLVLKITSERLSSSDAEIPLEKVNVITLSSLKLDLMKKCIKSNVSLHHDRERQQRQCDQKAGSFLLYNCARIGSILKQYDDMVDRNVYPPFPEDVNLGLLADSQEWELAFKYIYGQNELEADVKSCENFHKLVQFLISFSHDFSSYYNRTHILTDPREHLFPKMFARLFLLKRLKAMLEYWLLFLDLPMIVDI